MTDDVAALQAELARRTRELQAAEARFRNLIARNGDAIVVVDLHGVVRFGNPAAEAIFGWRADGLVGVPFGFPLLIGETTEIDVVGAAGDAVVAEMRVVETEWEGEPALLAVLRDISERKRLEAERAARLREQVARAEAEQALQERDAFLAVASHELRTPLSTLSVAAQLLRRRFERDGALEPGYLLESLGRLDTQARRISRLVEHLLDVSRINVDKMVLERQTVDLRALVDAVVERCRAVMSAGHSIVVRGPAQLLASVDPVRIEQVLINLLDNAVKYSPNGGEIEVELSAPTPAPSSTTGRPSTPGGSTVRLAVRDHGLGIPPDRRARLFERFYQAHTEGHLSGLGLGLFICRHIVERHGGRIWATHPEDGGTRFLVALPADGPDDAEPGAGPA
jgi:signal transduction histidine kinase